MPFPTSLMCTLPEFILELKMKIANIVCAMLILYAFKLHRNAVANVIFHAVPLYLCACIYNSPKMFAVTTHTKIHSHELRNSLKFLWAW